MDQTGLGLKVSFRPCLIQGKNISVNGSTDSFGRKDEYVFFFFYILLLLRYLPELLDFGTNPVAISNIF
jgi:hypothetical protein